MKKTLLSIVSIALVFSLIGCGKKDNSKSEEIINSNNSTNGVLESYTKQYGDHTKITYQISDDKQAFSIHVKTTSTGVAVDVYLHYYVYSLLYPSLSAGMVIICPEGKCSIVNMPNGEFSFLGSNMDHSWFSSEPEWLTSEDEHSPNGFLKEFVIDFDEFMNKIIE